MSADKMREEFEAWYFDRHMVANRWDGLIYDDSDQQEAWRASRAALVVELPPSEFFDDGENEWGYKVSAEAYRADAVRNALEAAGVRIKP